MSVLDPAMHAMQLALMPAPATAYEPTGHAPLHDAVVPMPKRAYRPALHGEHAVTFDDEEYVPAAHAMQLLPPA